MSSRNVKLILSGEAAKKAACREVLAANDGLVMTISEPVKKREQEEKYHAMIGDIADQCLFMGEKWHKDDWKRLLIDAFAQAMREAGEPLHHDSRVSPSLDGHRVVQLGIQSKDFRVKEAANFIEYLQAYGVENGVRFKAPSHERFAA